VIDVEGCVGWLVYQILGVAMYLEVYARTTVFKLLNRHCMGMRRS
jgi:hypothetical protein